MEQKDNILRELKELNSPLADTTPSTDYRVPPGYFEGIAGQVMQRVRAFDAATPGEELDHLSPLLNGISRTPPYSIPDGYFEQLKIVNGEVESGQEELEMLSPLLSGLKKNTPYSVPEGYFDTLRVKMEKEEKPVAKMITMGARKMYRYAAAAVVIGFVAIASVLFFNRSNNTGDKPADSYAWVEKNMTKVSTEDIDHFVELVDEKQQPAVAMAAQDEIKNLMKNVPDKDIQDFLNDTQTDDPLSDDDDDILLN
jgi:hypothetical protein